MTTQKKESHHLAQELHDEHARLGKQLQGLRNLLAGPFEWKELDKILADLEESALRHFDFEEKGGYLDEVSRRDPNQARAVDELRTEHDEMRSALRDARHLSIEHADIEELRQMLDDWLEKIHKHEAKENRVFQDALNTELGGGD